MNVPYVKATSTHELTYMNPYMSYEPNRRARRQQKQRFTNNRSGAHLTVLPTGKYRRVVQHYKTKEGNIINILHYLQ